MRHKFLPSFVQRKGRITKSQEKNLLSLPDYEISSYLEIQKAKNNFEKVILEIGFGNGENVFKFAKNNIQKLRSQLSNIKSTDRKLVIEQLQKLENLVIEQSAQLAGAVLD